MILYNLLKTMSCDDSDRIVLKNTKGSIYIDFAYGSKDWISPVLLASKVKNIKAGNDMLVITMEDITEEVE